MREEAELCPVVVLYLHRLVWLIPITNEAKDVHGIRQPPESASEGRWAGHQVSRAAAARAHPEIKLGSDYRVGPVPALRRRRWG